MNFDLLGFRFSTGTARKNQNSWYVARRNQRVKEKKLWKDLERPIYKEEPAQTRLSSGLRDGEASC